MSYICFSLVLDIVCCVQTNSGTMRLTIAPPWVQRRWSSKRRREGENGGRRWRRRVEENFYLYLACLLFSFIIILFFLTPNFKAWRVLWSLFSVFSPFSLTVCLILALLCFSFFLLCLIPPPPALPSLFLSLSLTAWACNQRMGTSSPLFRESVRCLVHLHCAESVSLLSSMNSCWEVKKSGFIEFVGCVTSVILLQHYVAILSRKNQTNPILCSYP